MSPALLRLLSCLLRGLSANELMKVHVCDCLLVWHSYRKMTFVIFLPLFKARKRFCPCILFYGNTHVKEMDVTWRLKFDVHQQPPRSPVTVTESSFSVTWKRKRGLYGTTGGKTGIMKYPSGWLSLFGGGTAVSVFLLLLGTKLWS